jgi:hypothetical protein
MAQIPLVALLPGDDLYVGRPSADEDSAAVVINCARARSDLMLDEIARCDVLF